MRRISLQVPDEKGVGPGIIEIPEDVRAYVNADDRGDASTVEYQL